MEVPTSSCENATFEVNLQYRPAPTQSVVEVEVVILSIQAGTVTLVPALTDADTAGIPPAEIPYNAPTSVSRERSIGAKYFRSLNYVKLMIR